MVFLLIAIISSAAMSLALKFFRDQKGNRFGILFGNYVMCVLISFLTLPEKAQVLSGERFTVVFGIVTGCFFMLGLYMMQTCAAVNGAILTATFSKLGLLVPLTLSIVFFRERPGMLQYLGIILVIISFFLIQPEKEKGSGAKPLILLLTLLAVGCSDSGARIFEHFGSRSDDRLYYFFIFAAACVICFGLSRLEKRKTGKKMLPRELAAGLVLGVANYYSSYLLLAALTVLPGYLVYTVFSVGTIILVTLISVPAFGEKLSAKQAGGMAVILTALVLLNI